MIRNIYLIENGTFSAKEIDILSRNKKFYESDIKYVDTLLSILEGKSKISIRAIEWFVVNYSKDKDTRYNIKVDGTIKSFGVNQEYNTQLHGYSKQHFDPFCRKRKITYKYCQNKSEPIIFISSIGQLNFFHWAIKNKIIKYIELHLPEIEKNMRDVTKENKKRKLQSPPNTRKINNIIVSDEPDPEICSTDKINNINLIDMKKFRSSKNLEKKRKRNKLSSNDTGIKISNGSFYIDFD